MTSLAEIKQIAGLHLHENLFDTIVVVENYPLDEILLDPQNVLTCSAYSVFEKG